MIFDSRETLTASGGKSDSDIDLFVHAMALAMPGHEGISTDKYFNHVSKLIRDVGEKHKNYLDNGAKDDAGTQLAALKDILCNREAYVGDDERYDDLQNADIIRVIDRRKGMPITLCILYIHVGRACGWQVDGLNFPGHFLARIEYGGERLIFDPFASCAVLGAAELRQLLKKVRGPNAELSTDYYKACSNRDILIRLQNNVKLRLIEAEDYTGALESVEMMRLLAPGEYRLLFDAGVLYAKTGKKKAAADVLEKYLSGPISGAERRDAEWVLRGLED